MALKEILHKVFGACQRMATSDDEGLHHAADLATSGARLPALRTPLVLPEGGADEVPGSMPMVSILCGPPPPYMSAPPPYNQESTDEPPIDLPNIELEPPPPYSAIERLSLSPRGGTFTIPPDGTTTAISSSSTTTTTSSSTSITLPSGGQRMPSPMIGTARTTGIPRTSASRRRSKRDANLFALMRNGNGLTQMIASTVGACDSSSSSAAAAVPSASSTRRAGSRAGTRSSSMPETNPAASGERRSPRRERSEGSSRERSRSRKSHATGSHAAHHRRPSARAHRPSTGSASDMRSRKTQQLEELAYEFSTSQNPYRKLAIVMEIARIKNDNEEEYY